MRKNSARLTLESLPWGSLNQWQRREEGVIGKSPIVSPVLRLDAIYLSRSIRLVEHYGRPCLHDYRADLDNDRSSNLSEMNICKT